MVQEAHVNATNPDAANALGGSAAVLGSTAAIGVQDEDGGGNGVNPVIKEAARGRGQGARVIRSW